MGWERDACRWESDLAGADGGGDLAVGETNPKWVIGVVNLKRGGICVSLADENTIGTGVGSGGGRMNFYIYNWGHWRKRRSRRSNVLNLIFINIK